MDQLACSTIVFRTITRASDLDPDTGTPAANVFMLRELPADKHGLSVDYDVAVPEGCAPRLDPKSKKAIVSLHTGRVRDLGLDIVPTSDTHANIKNLPRADGDDPDPERAEQFAAKLVAMSRKVWAKSQNQ